MIISSTNNNTNNDIKQYNTLLNIYRLLRIAVEMSHIHVGFIYVENLLFFPYGSISGIKGTKWASLYFGYYFWQVIAGSPFQVEFDFTINNKNDGCFILIKYHNKISNKNNNKN